MSSFTNKLSENSINCDLCDFEADCKVQTESSDSNITVNVVSLLYLQALWSSTKLKLTPPATCVLHPLWGLGRYEDEDEKHIYYRFDGNEVNSG